MFSEQHTGNPTLQPAIRESIPTSRLRMRNVLCPIDFSEFSDKAFSYAAAIARHFHSRLVLQHVLQPLASTYLGSGDPGLIPGLVEAEWQQAGAKMRRLAAVARLHLPEVRMIVSDSYVRDGLLRTAEEDHADLVVMGTHGRKGFNRLVLGSVTEALVQDARCPVLVLCRPLRDFVAPQEVHPLQLKTIVMATDFSPNSDHALAYAVQWASECSAKIILFHAVEENSPDTQGRVDLFPEYNQYFEQTFSEALEKIQHRIAPRPGKNVEISREVRLGNAKEEILRFAAQKSPDLIVMGIRGLAETSSAWGSTVSAVMRDGRFPVLAVPDPSTNRPEFCAGTPQ